MIYSFKSHDIWFEDPVFVLRDDGVEAPVSFWATYAKVYLPCILWGMGTAFGEIPPYALSYANAAAGKEDEQFKQITQEANASPSLYNRMMSWMINFMERHGFVGVFLMYVGTSEMQRCDSLVPNMPFC